MTADVAAIRASVRASYDTPEALATYVARADQGLRRWETELVRTALPAMGRVLVIGCGAGRESFALDALGYQVSGVDVAPSLVEAARARDTGGRCDFQVVDGASLPFSEASFDAATLWSQVIAYVPTRRERVRFLAEVARVVRPGGPISLSAHDTALTLAEMAPDQLISQGDPEPGDVLVRDRDAVRLMHYFDDAELRDLFAEAGLGLRLLAHSDDLGESWGNLFVAVGARET